MISSLSNPRVKFMRKLQKRKERQESGLFLVEGIRLVVEAVKQKAEIVTIIVAPDLLDSVVGQELVSSQLKDGVDVLEVTAEVFSSISSKDGPQGLAAVLRQKVTPLKDVHIQKDDLWIALDSVADPGNLGTILRTGDAVGARGVILLDHCVDAFDPGVARASMGAIFTQKIILSHWSQFCEWKLLEKVNLVGTSGAASLDYWEYTYPFPLVVLMGSERQGLTEDRLKFCDAVVRIPMQGFSDSLNLSVATGVVLYAVYNQQRFGRSVERK